MSSFIAHLFLGILFFVSLISFPGFSLLVYKNVNSASTNTGMHVSFPVFPGVGLLGHRVTLFLFKKNTFYLLCIVGEIIWAILQFFDFSL